MLRRVLDQVIDMRDYFGIALNDLVELFAEKAYEVDCHTQKDDI